MFVQCFHPVVIEKPVCGFGISTDIQYVTFVDYGIRGSKFLGDGFQESVLCPAFASHLKDIYAVPASQVEFENGVPYDW